MYKHRCKNTGKEYAVKELQLVDGHAVKEALAEADMLQEVMRNVSHPNIMQVYYLNVNTLI